MERHSNEKMYFHYGTTEEMLLMKQTDICQIYNKLLDDASRQIFADRLLFSLTNDWSFIRDMLIKTGNWSDMDKILTARKGLPIYIYGAGISGGRLPLIFPEYSWHGYIDKNKKGETCNNLPIYGIEKCRELPKEALIVISNMTGEKEIRNSLLELGILNENIISFVEYTRKAALNIYFEDNCLNKEQLKGKVFVDAGAYDGADTIHYMNWMNQMNAKTIVFEADSDNFEITKKNLSAYPQVILYNQGLSDKQGQQSFLSGKGEMSNFSTEGNYTINMNFLDNVASDMEIGYIKMDIEGFEKQALIGAKKIIAEQKPALGISVYHKREDIWEIPKLILSLHSDYRFFLRHYSLGVIDTVLYAVRE